LLASNDELKKKVQELAQASQDLQVSLFKEVIPLFTSAYISLVHCWYLSPQKELSEKQQCLDEQQREMAALTEKLSSLQV